MEVKRFSLRLFRLEEVLQFVTEIPPGSRRDAWRWEQAFVSESNRHIDKCVTML